MGDSKLAVWKSRLAARARRAATPYTFFLVSFALLCFGVQIGPDYERYAEWSAAILSHDLRHLAGPQALESPTGVPFRQWPAGPGLLMAPFSAIVSPVAGSVSAGLVAGCACVLVFWSCLFAGLRALSDDRLAFLGCATAFVATPLGYYSLTVSSETYSLLPAGILFLNTVALGQRKRVSLLGIGASTGLLLMLRSFLAAYAWPALCVAFIDECRRGAKQAARCLLIFAVPIALAILQIGVVNYWMTGDYLRSPYQFGDELFQSLDWTCPHLWSVLGDTYHGLLPTHPLMGIGFLLMPWLIATSMRNGRHREAMLWLLAAVAVGVNVYVQGCWYYWWLLYFGMRGLTLASIPVIAAFVRAQSLPSPGISDTGRRATRAALLGLAGGCVVWSWLLLAQAQISDYCDWSELLRGELAQIKQWLSLEGVGLLFYCGILVALVLRQTFGRLDRTDLTMWVMWVAGTLSIAFLLKRLMFHPAPPLGPRFYAVVATATAAVVLGATFKPTVRVQSVCPWVAILLLCAMLALFAPFAVRTQRALRVTTNAPAVVDESHLMAAYRDLVYVPRMAAHRQHIGDFLKRRKGAAWYEQFQKSAFAMVGGWFGVDANEGDSHEHDERPSGLP